MVNSYLIALFKHQYYRAEVVNSMGGLNNKTSKLQDSERIDLVWESLLSVERFVEILFHIVKLSLQMQPHRCSESVWGSCPEDVVQADM